MADAASIVIAAGHSFEAVVGMTCWFLVLLVDSRVFEFVQGHFDERVLMFGLVSCSCLNLITVGRYSFFSR